MCYQFPGEECERETRRDATIIQEITPGGTTSSSNTHAINFERPLQREKSRVALCLQHC